MRRRKCILMGLLLASIAVLWFTKQWADAPPEPPPPTPNSPYINLMAGTTHDSHFGTPDLRAEDEVASIAKLPQQVERRAGLLDSRICRFDTSDLEGAASRAAASSFRGNRKAH
jgi:hypothetical protein